MRGLPPPGFELKSAAPDDRRGDPDHQQRGGRAAHGVLAAQPREQSRRRHRRGGPGQRRHGLFVGQRALDLHQLSVHDHRNVPRGVGAGDLVAARHGRAGVTHPVHAVVVPRVVPARADLLPQGGGARRGLGRDRPLPLPVVVDVRGRRVPVALDGAVLENADVGVARLGVVEHGDLMATGDVDLEVGVAPSDRGGDPGSRRGDLGDHRAEVARAGGISAGGRRAHGDQEHGAEERLGEDRSCGHRSGSLPGSGGVGPQPVTSTSVEPDTSVNLSTFRCTVTVHRPAIDRSLPLSW